MKIEVGCSNQVEVWFIKCGTEVALVLSVGLILLQFSDNKLMSNGVEGGEYSEGGASSFKDYINLCAPVFPRTSSAETQVMIPYLSQPQKRYPTTATQIMTSTLGRRAWYG